MSVRTELLASSCLSVLNYFLHHICPIWTISFIMSVRIELLASSCLSILNYLLHHICPIWTISFIMSVRIELFASSCLSVLNNSAPTGRILMKFGIWIFFENLPGKFKFHWNLTGVKGTLHETDRCTSIIIIISLSVLFRMKNVSDKNYIETQNTHFVFNNFFLSENRAVYEIMWKNTVERGRPQMTIWRMRVSCRITKTKDTHSEYVILIAFVLQQWLHERASLLSYMYAACLVRHHLCSKEVIPLRSRPSVRPCRSISS